MEVGIDSVWASPTTLHLRVLVWVGQERYCKKFYASVPVSEIEPDAVRALMSIVPDEPDPISQDVPLF